MRRALLSFVCLSLCVACAGAPEPGGKEPPPKDNDDPEPEPCIYPEATALTGVGSIMPNVAWTEAFRPDGTTIDFSLEDFHCSSAWDAYDSVIFILVAEWCPNCPEYLGHIEDMAADIEAAGSYLVLLDVETREYELPSNVSAQAYFTSKIGSEVGLRVGDGDADPRGLIYAATIWSAVPSGFLVRKSDMQVIVNQDEWQTVLDWPTIAQHMDADWSDPNNPPFFSTCAEGDEEPSEPNDLPNQAAALDVGTVSGGICTSEPDFYQVDLAGDWRIDLELDPNVGDLDVYVVSPGTNEPLMDGNDYVGSATFSGVESFTYAGPATVMVHGYMNSSAPYTLTLSGL